MDNKDLSLEELHQLLLVDDFNLEIIEKLKEKLPLPDAEHEYNFLRWLFRPCDVIAIYHTSTHKVIKWVRAYFANLIPDAQEYFIKLVIQICDKRLEDKKPNLKYILLELARTNFTENAEQLTAEMDKEISYFTGRETIAAEIVISSYLQIRGYLLSKKEQINGFIQKFGTDKIIVELGRKVNLDNIETVLPKKLKWLGTPSQFGFIMDLLIQGGYLEKPSTHFSKDAAIYLEHFTIGGTSKTIAKELSEPANSLSTNNRNKIKIPHKDTLK